MKKKRGKGEKEKQYGIDHQFMVLSRRMGVEIMAGWTGRRSRVFET